MISRKLECGQVKTVIKEFFKGETTTSIAKLLNVSPATILNVLRRVSYKECYDPLKDFSSLPTYMAAVDTRLRENMRLSKGRPR
jgi:IS30 family transposase